MIRRALLLLASAALLAACDDPTSSGDRLALESVSGNAQEGLPGNVLLQVLTVRVARPDGTPAAGVVVRFQAAPGAGSMEPDQVLTNEAGLAWAAWRMPNEPGAALSATAHVEGASQPVTFTAGLLPRERADLLMAVGAAGLVRVLLHAPGALTAASAMTLTDSLLLPLASPTEDRSAVLAFTSGRPPLLRHNLAWTAGRDTLRLEFPQPVSVPVTIWVVRAPYDVVRARMEAQLQTAYEIWADAGILLTDVRWVDATGHPKAEGFQGTTATCGGVPGVIGKDAGRTNVYVVGGPLFNGTTYYGGYACAPDFITFANSQQNAPTLLAHELGHTFGLAHIVGNNVMDPVARFSYVTTGQKFLAHAHSGSSLQIMHGDRAVMPGRNCAGFTTPAGCLPATWEF